MVVALPISNFQLPVVSVIGVDGFLLDLNEVANRQLAIDNRQ